MDNQDTYQLISIHPLINPNHPHSICSKSATLALSTIVATLLLSACATTPSGQFTPSATPETSKTSEVEEKPESLTPFLQKLSQQHHIPLNDLQKAFEDAKTIPSIKKLVLPPPPGFQKNWKVYRSRFVEPKRLTAGQQFWRNLKKLERFSN